MSRSAEPRPANRRADGPGPSDAVEPLVVPGSVAEAIAREMESAYPGEGCGVLVGRAEEGGRRLVRTAVPSPNRWPGRDTRYRVDPGLLRRLLEEEENAAEAEDTPKAAAGARGAAGDRTVLGFYHSHPDAPPEPSATDLEHGWPWYHYLIIPVLGGRAGRGRVWTLGDGGFRERPLLVAESEAEATGGE